MTKIFVFLMTLYQVLFSPLLHHLGVGGCRYDPTCSEYTIQMVQKHGIGKGLLLGVKRLATCHPFAKVTTHQV